MDRDERILTGRARLVTGDVSAAAILSRLAGPERAAGEDILLATGLVGDGPGAARAAEALHHHRIEAIIAPRFARPFFRICINTGLAPLTLWEAAEIRAHDRLRIDVNDAIVKDLSSGTRYAIRDLSDRSLDILSCGGMSGYVLALRAERSRSG